MPVHLYHSTDDFFMTVCSRNGLRSAYVIICLSSGYLKISLTSLFAFQSDVVHIHVSPVEPMPSRLCHRFIVRSLQYCRNFAFLSYKKTLSMCIFLKKYIACLCVCHGATLCSQSQKAAHSCQPQKCYSRITGSGMANIRETI